MNLTDWLFEHAQKTYTPKEWSELIGVKILDPDGWRGQNKKDFSDPIGLLEFIERLVLCTIQFRKKTE